MSEKKNEASEKTKRAQGFAHKIMKFVNPTAEKAVKKKKFIMSKVKEELEKISKK